MSFKKSLENFNKLPYKKRMTLLLTGVSVLSVVFMLTLIVLKDTLYSRMYPNSDTTHANRQARTSEAKYYKIPSKLAMNDSIETTKKISVWVNPPFRGKYSGKQANGSNGVIVDGPVRVADSWWWNVDFGTGADGWANEDYLKKTGGSGQPPQTPPAVTYSLPAPLIISLQPENGSRVRQSQTTLSGKVFDYVSPASELGLYMNGAPVQLKPDGSFTTNLTTGTTTYTLKTRGVVRNPRQQTNTITAFIDGSVVYGSDPGRAAALRTFSGGKLKTSEGNLLPYNTADLPNANDAHIFPNSQLFLSGDIRANENVELTSIHTLFLREHNRIAEAMAQKSPGLTDEQLFQRTRQIIAAEIQVITYKEFIPALLGDKALKPYKGYNAEVNPGIANEFSTGAFRIGHTLINDDVEFLDNEANPVIDEMPLAFAFFNPGPLKQVGPDPILKYLATDNAQEVDTKLVDGLRNFLFGPPGAGGLDLASLNIQRGRDHGLADFNAIRKAYGLKPYTDFSQITSDTELQEKLKALYGDINAVDLWVGGLAEDHVAGGSVGETFRKIIADQFERTRDGDNYWYQRVFSGRQLAAIEATRLSDIIRRNTIITKIQDNVFFFDDETTLPSLKAKAGTLPPELVGVPNWKSETILSYDGSNNNTQYPDMGKAGIDLLRMSPAGYADGMSTPAGPYRPNPRLISNTISAMDEESQEEDAPRNNRDLSDWIYGWGQFLDHDLDLTTSGSTSYDIQVPANDPQFDPEGTGQQVITLKRSIYDQSTGTGIEKTREVQYKLSVNGYGNGKRVRTKGRANIYAGPSYKSQLIAEQKDAGEGTIISDSKEADGQTWWRVYFNGKSGWLTESEITESP